MPNTTGNEPDDKELHPAHYNAHPSGIECIDVVQHFTFSIGTVIKHLWRAGLKDVKDTEIESTLSDHYKARNYLNFEITRLEKIRDNNV